MMHWGYGMGAGGWLAMTALWLVLIVAAVALAIWIFPTESQRREDDPPSGHTPRDVLDERLARGEIDVETHQVLLAELTRASTPGR
jgi:putative membrane protein